jgi:hypothetical protein
MEEILGEIERGLEGSGFATPTSYQFIGTNGLPHTALIAELEQRGEKMLPPAHYGFLVSHPQSMRDGNNPVRARAWAWAVNATILHAPTGARVEATVPLLEKITEYNEAYLHRTGRVPELEHEGPEGLRVLFPMTSQEAVPRAKPEFVKIARPRGEDEWYESVKRRDIDRLIASHRAGEIDRDLLGRVTDRIDVRGVSDYAAEDDALNGLWVSPDVIAAEYDAIDESVLREVRGLDACEPVTDEHRVEYLELWRMCELEEDREIAHLLRPVVLTATSGETVTLVADSQGYDFTDVRTRWLGPVGTSDAYRERIEREGWVKGVEGFRGLAMGRKVEIARRGVRKANK